MTSDHPGTIQRTLRSVLACLALFVAQTPAAPAGAQDTLVVRADNPPVWGPSPRLVEELRIGSVLGPEESALGSISRYWVSPGGTIWVPDGITGSIRRFTSEGNVLEEIGGHGEGPGEFSNLLTVVGLPNGEVAAWDMSQKRISLFSSDGEFVRSILVPGGNTGGVRQPIQVDDSNNLYVRMGPYPPSALQAQADPSLVWRGYSWLKLSYDGEILDTIPIPSEGKEGTPDAAQTYLFASMEAYPARTLSFLTRKGVLVTGRTSDYTFVKPMEDGRYLRIEKAWDPVPVQRAERAAFQAQEDQYSARWRRNSERIPAQKPPWWAFWVDEEERLWVARHGEGFHRPASEAKKQRLAAYGNAPIEWWEPLTFDVIEGGGRFMGTIRFPNPQTDLAVARGQHVWVIEAGEFDENYVVRYRIEPGL